MNKIRELPNQDKVHTEASEWLAKLDRGLTADERVALQRWLVESRENRTLLFNMAELWDKMDSLSRLSDLFPDVSGERRPAWRYGLAAAASVFVVGVLVFWGLPERPERARQVPPQVRAERAQPSPGDFSDIYETSVGEHSSVNLPDGTAVILNTNSLIRVNYTGAERYIVLSRGEAHFTVAEDTNRPLTVRAGNRFIRAVGTAFNVEIGKHNIVEIIVTEGKVVIVEQTASGKKGIAAGVIKMAQDAPVISEGEAAVLDSTDAQVRKIAPEEVAVDLSWREGNLIFQGETLEEAIDEISRYTSVEFEILDDRIRAVRVAGLFKAGDINGLLLTLQENFQIPSQRVGTERVLLGVR